jgi:hypothetical protein
VLGAAYTAQPAATTFTFTPALEWPSKPGTNLPQPAVDSGRWWSNDAGYTGVFYSWNFTALQKAGIYDVRASHINAGSNEALPLRFRCPTTPYGRWATDQTSCRVYVWPGPLASLTAAAEAGADAVAGDVLVLTVYGWDSLGNAAWFASGLPNDTRALSLSSNSMSAQFRSNLSAQLVDGHVAGPGACSGAVACDVNLAYWVDSEVPGKMYVNVTATRAGSHSIVFRDANQVRQADGPKPERLECKPW